MPAVVACPKCEKKFKLPDSMLGKGIKCPSCGAQFKTPAPRTANANQRTKPANQQALAQQAKALKAMGVEGTIERPPDVFGSDAMPGTADPLSNHMIQDPGFGEGAEAAIAPKQIDKPDDPFASMFANPALAKEEKKKKGGKKKGKQSEGLQFTDPAFLLGAIFIPLFALSLIFSYTEVVSVSSNGYFTFAIFLLFTLVTIGIGIWGYVLVYQVSESVVQLLLCIFIPFYILYFFYVNWEEMKYYANVYFTAVLVGALGNFAFDKAMALVDELANQL